MISPAGLNPSHIADMQGSMTPSPVGPSSPPGAVHSVQDSLKDLGYKIESKEDQADTYGASTQAAVREFQKGHQLPETGIADGRTQLAILQALRQQHEQRSEMDAFEAALKKPPFSLRG